MYLLIDGHALIAGVATLRTRRKLPPATLRVRQAAACHLAEFSCGPLSVSVPVLDRRHWAGVLTFDGILLKDIARLPVNDLFMTMCLVEFIAGNLTLGETFSGVATVLPETMDQGDAFTTDV